MTKGRGARNDNAQTKGPGAGKAGTQAGVMRGNFVWEAQMKLDEVHYKVHEESLQCAPNLF